jgi:hypothetical protein
MVPCLLSAMFKPVFISSLFFSFFREADLTNLLVLSQIAITGSKVCAEIQLFSNSYLHSN